MENEYVLKFLAENHFADLAVSALEEAHDEPENSPLEAYWLSTAQARATLALAFEKWKANAHTR